MSDIAAGSIVVHLIRPEWGPGKVFCRDGAVALVGFRPLNQRERVLRLEVDGFLALAAPGDYRDLTGWDVLADKECHQVKSGEVKKAGVGKSKKPTPLFVPEWSNDQAYECFLGHYPKGFAEPRYAKLERDWKWAQHRWWLTLLPGNRLRSLAGRDPAAAAKSIMKVVQTAEKPLLHPRGEIAVMSGALKTPQATAYFDALANFVGARTPARELFDVMVDALTSLPTKKSTSRIGTWPIATVVPFLARPDRHMFVKPARTKEAARRLGVDLRYSSQLKWDTYERVLDWSDKLLDYLRPHGAVDMIDVQSFIWTIAR